jgi:hypothetical protein
LEKSRHAASQLRTGSVINCQNSLPIFGGTAGDQYDPCYHLACDTFDNVNLEVLDQNSDAIAAAILYFAKQKNR